MRSRQVIRFVPTYLLSLCSVWAQSAGATFGEVIRLGGTPSDIVLDESRSRLYLVSQSGNRIDVYSYLENQVVGSIAVGSGPVAAAMSMDSAWLYVTNNTGSSMSVISLARGAVVQTVSLPAKPEGIEVGNDGRVLISTEGTNTTGAIESLQLYDPVLQQVTAVSFPPPPATPSTLPAAGTTRPVTTFRGKLIRTPDGAFLIGLSTVNSNAQTVMFVYETASASILRSRTVTGQSTILSVAPDGSRFMAGSTLYDTATLTVMAQQSAANVPFPLNSTNTSASFSVLQNVGGSVFAPDGKLLYSAFNVAPFSNPAARPQASTLLLSDPRHLRVQLGIKIPESIIAKMVMTADAAHAWGLSESGLIHLPLATLYDYPILQPETTTVFLAVDNCNHGLATGTLRVNNAGRGKLTFSVPDTTAALVAQASTGVAPATITFTLEPGRTSVTRQYGTNLYSGAATNSGAALQVNLASPDAINIPNTVQVYMNVRTTDQRGVIYPVVSGTSAAEGLQDVVIDEQRDRVYVTNAGYNRVEVFDRTAGTFLAPIEVGQLPHQMAMSSDSNTLYVANTGGESISVVDLNLGLVVDSVAFSPIPRSGNAAPITPVAIAMTVFGLQVVMSDGSQWKSVNNQLTLRPTDAVAPALFSTTSATGPPRLIAAADGLSMIALAANGTAYLYDGLSDTYAATNRPYTSTTIQGYYGPVGAGAQGSFFLMNGFILNSSLAAIGGSESPSSTTAGALASRRNVAALAPVDGTSFVRVTTPVKQNLTSTPTTDARPTLELVDLARNSVTVIGPIGENPQFSLFGTSRINVPSRQMAVDSHRVVYVITLSGLSVIPLTPTGTNRPAISSGSSAVVNATNAAAGLSPGSFLKVTGQNLAADGIAAQVPPPSILGGSCLTLSDIATPLLQTSSGQILAQIPDQTIAGTYVLRVRSLATGQQSDAVMVTVKKSQ